MTVERDDARVDRLRRQLRSLGYLEAGVDRFVLGGARERRRPVTIAVLASLRIGLLAALLTGPAAAIGISGRIPGLITGPRDGFVVAVYTGALFGAGVSLVASIAILLISAIAWRGDRGRRTAALVAGLLVAAGSLAYLTLWWNVSTLAGEPGMRRAIWTSLALAWVAAVSLIIGHGVTVAALAVSVARGAGVRRFRVPGASRRVMTTAGLLGFVGALLLFNLTAGYDRGRRDAPPLVVVSSGERIRLIAVDGFDPGIAKRLAESGRLPALASALGLNAESGPDTRGPTAPEPAAAAVARIAFADTLDPARVWTTVATGHTADAHAVRGLEMRRVFGVQGALAADEPSSMARALAGAGDLIRLTRPAIASGDQRRVKSLWEIASSTGLQTVVVNWWASWPAPADGGIVVTDRATLRLERGGQLDAEIAPASVYDALRTRWPELRQQATEAATALEDESPSEPLLKRSAELDALQLAISRVITGPNTDLACVYLPGLDLVQHRLLTSPAGAAPSPSSMAARLATLERYYLFLDRLLAPALTGREGEVVVLLTSPGRVEGGPPGLLSVRGPVANGRARDALARPVDIAPTLLHALGIPISRELPGRALIELFSAEFARRNPVREVSTYGTPPPSTAARSGTPLDEEMIDRLRSLGYIR